MDRVHLDDSDSRTRRRPQQRRSREKVDRVLATVETLLVETPHEQITIRMILDRSGVPAGTFYAYFPDKTAAIEQLAFRYVEDVNGMLIDWRRRNTADTWEDLVGEVIRAYSDWAAHRPAFVRLWTSDQLGPALVQYEQTTNRHLGSLLRDALCEIVPAAADVPDHVYRFSIELIDQMMRFSFRETDPERRATFEAEVTAAATNYLATRLPRTGSPG